ncbi:aminotransferase class III-fold pyridoxal phosphate-dependent enzyme [Lacipirellula limnantheis]|uniref:Acetylornithine/succinyldiaminopimelate aminotransferase n=1 Tax=Lacipirellula limnantheis TaxID=2528024 RepID=A0A517TZS6_9BACT|nr:aminotransferase class III-fold pyridoxal phosphate-dependent enzyme [Lacipirellula limnantheis]QDT73872.1 Acetylornithine/succinyldiaminopimelate aminotransferase [Lacipirellula limnantheis]
MSSAEQINAVQPRQRREPESDATRRAIAHAEPRALRTYTPTLAVIERSAGSYHYTAEGAKLADFTSGVLVANLGHNPIRWWRRVHEYLGHPPTVVAGASDDGSGERLAAESDFFAAAPLTAYNAITPLEAEACRRLTASLQSLPGGRRLEQVVWAASGSEGVIKALRTALAQDPARQIILATRHGFHGKKGLAGAVTGSERDAERDARVRFISFPREECYSLAKRQEPLNLAPYIAELKQLAAELGDQLCCLITEPYLGGGGSYHPQREYLQLLQAFCREQRIPFILDEVQSNFGRTGSLYAFADYGVEPDMVVLGKGMGNGIPVDAVVGRADLFDKLHYGEVSDTWSGHPLGCAAVLATLDEFEQTDVLAHGRALSRVFEAGLQRLTATRAVAAIRGEGNVWGVQCAPLPGRTSREVACAIVRACYDGDEAGRAIHLLGPLSGDVIRIAPPLVMPLDEAQEYLDAMYGIIDAIS